MSTQAITPAPFTGTYTVDPVHSSFGFAVRHMGISTFRGTFGDVAATVTAAPDGTVALAGEARADSISIVAPPEMRAHLLSEDFFDAARHPAITFRSTRVTRAAGGFRMTGALTIRGVTREVTLDATFEGSGRDPWGADRVSFSAESKIDRRDFGLTWNAALETGGVLVGKDITINLDLQGALQQD